VRYATPAALRAAIGQRLVQQADQTGVDIVRLRRRVVFERLLVRFAYDDTARRQHAAGVAELFPARSRRSTRRPTTIRRLLRRPRVSRSVSKPAARWERLSTTKAPTQAYCLVRGLLVGARSEGFEPPTF
jgi:hypothetical protein